MSATISLKHSMKRSTNAAINLIQHALLITGLILIIGTAPNLENISVISSGYIPN